MDAGLFLIINNSSLNKLNIIRDEYIWGNEKFFKDDIYYSLTQEKVFKKSILAEWVSEKIPDNFLQPDYSVLLLENDQLDKLEVSINNSNDIQHDELINTIKTTLDFSNEWVMIFLHKWDQIDEILGCKNETAINKLISNLSWDNDRKGLVFFKK